MKKSFVRIIAAMLCVIVLFSVPLSIGFNGIITFNADAANFVGETYTNLNNINLSLFIKYPAFVNKVTKALNGSAGFIYNDFNCTKFVDTTIGKSTVPNNNVLQYIKCNNAPQKNKASGTSCYIYANGLFNYLFGDIPTVYLYGASDKVEGPGRGMNQQYVINNNILPGTFLCIGSHYIVYLGSNNDNIIYADGNGDGRGLIAVRKQTWSNFNKKDFYSGVQWLCKPKVDIFKKLYGDFEKPTGPSEINLNTSGEGGKITKPTGTLPKGKSFGLYGYISSKYKITKVIAGILNARTNEVVNGLSVVDYPDFYGYDLHGKVNELDFKKLTDGKYKYIVGVFDEKDYKIIPKVVIYQEFNVGNGGNGSSGAAASNTDFATIAGSTSSGLVIVDKPQPNLPTFDVKATSGGYFVYLKAKESGAEIRYTTNGSNPTKSSTKYNGGFAVKSTCTVKAIAIKNGVASGISSRTVTVNKIAQPSIVSTLTKSDYTVTISCTTSGAKIYYTLDGSNPSTSKYYYNSPIHIKSGTTIKAFAVKDGCANSNVSTKTITVKTPASPGIEIPTGTNVAVNDPIEIRWSAKENATSHKVRIYRNGSLIETKSVSGSKFAYIPKTAGSYTFGVDAVNFKGTTGSDSSKTITAHNPVTVRFEDYNGTLIKQQKVKYGYSASSPASTPKRKGYVFKAWSSQAYINAKNDVTITAVYEPQKYLVRFIDENGKTCATQQEVEYMQSVVLPADPSTTLEGYTFAGWRVISSDKQSALDYTKVDANLTLQAVFDWSNQDLPVAVQSVTATKNDVSSYSVSATLNNGSDRTIYCRMLITLKTSVNKCVRTVYKDVILQPNTNNQDVGTTEIICDSVATKACIYIVGLDDTLSRTGGAYAKLKSVSITDLCNYHWSSWSASTPPSDSDYQTRTMYSYRDKSTKDSTSSSLSGWTQNGSTVSYSSWSANKTTTSKPTASDTLQIISTKKTYNYYHYCNYYDGHWNTDSIAYGSQSQYHSFSTTEQLPDCPDSILGGDKGGKLSEARGWRNGSPKHSCGDHDKWIWWLKSTTTTYTYQTRTKTTTYHYYKWGDWSSWSTTKVTAIDGKREVKTTPNYRYKIYDTVAENGENNNATIYKVSLNNISLLGTPGVIPNTDKDYSGKKANVIVYKASLNDPTANYIMHVSQFTIGEGNTYDSFAIIPSETPDEAESNFTVALAIEGQTSLINIGTIYSSKSKYDVEFFVDGQSIGKQSVNEGDDAIVPTPPEVPGKVFVGWDNDTTNVIAPRTINAYYVDETYSVVFVDFETDYITMAQYKYGDIIGIPDAVDVDGKTFIGWEGLDEDDPIAKENAVYIAKYETGTFTVKFEDGFGNTVSTQTVEYGKAAELPAAPEKEGLVFLGWKQELQWWNVKNDMTVTPIWVYENTVVQPAVSIENLYFGGEISAETDTEGATLFFAIDDGKGEPPMTIAQLELEESNVEYEEPDIDDNNNEQTTLSMSLINLFTTRAFADDSEVKYENENYGYSTGWNEYDSDMLLNEDATIYFYAVADDMNDSEIVTLNYKYEPVANPYEDHTDETFTVTFLDDDGFVLDEQTVNYFEDAIAPEIEEREGFVFTGWDNRFDHVTEDIEVTAQYVPENEYVTFTLNSEAVTLTAGDTYSLNVTVVNAPEDMGDIVWESSNETVATVSIDGFVMTNQAGETVITAKEYNNPNYSASCKVTVLPNANETVTLNTGSKLSLENGLLTEIPIVLTGRSGVAATVGEIKEQLATPGVKIVDSESNEMDDSKPITTGTQIRIIIDDIAVDAVIAIVYGDYDGNGSVNNKDASRIMRYLVSKETPDEYQLYASDVNKDGDVNNRDAAMVSRFLVGKETL